MNDGHWDEEHAMYDTNIVERAAHLSVRKLQFGL